ncbi:MAG TPA: hypothetical protein VMM81_01980 [Acidimicrobiia bacterium]|nr:hypothetical protein [Acidimicrobiia bacterium]
MDADPSASDTSELSGGVLCGVALCGGFDAPADSLPGLVGVGGGVVDGDVVSGWVCSGLSVVSGVAASWRGVERLVDAEAGLSGDGGLVDPVPGDGLGEDVGCGDVSAGDDLGVVGVSSAGHRRVETTTVDRTVDEEECEVDGAALGGVAGLGVAEFEMLSGVIGGETDGAGWSGDGDRTVGMDGLDGPVVPVLDHGTAVGAEAALIAAGDDFVADQ